MLTASRWSVVSPADASRSAPADEVVNEDSLRHIVIAVDDEPASAHAVQWAAKNLVRAGGDLVLLCRTSSHLRSAWPAMLLLPALLDNSTPHRRAVALISETADARPPSPERHCPFRGDLSVRGGGHGRQHRLCARAWYAHANRAWRPIAYVGHGLHAGAPHQRCMPV